jgi:hypothetical protein
MINRLVAVTLLSLPLAVACKKDKADAGGNTKTAENTQAAAPAAPAFSADLTETLDVGAAITDPDVKDYAGLKVKAPKGAKVEADLSGVMVHLAEGKTYSLTGHYDDAWLGERKTNAETNTLDKLVKFHIDTPTAILWEDKSGLGGPNNFLFAAVVTVGEKKFKCTSDGYGSFVLAEAEAALKSCQSAAK